MTDRTKIIALAAVALGLAFVSAVQWHKHDKVAQRMKLFERIVASEAFKLGELGVEFVKLQEEVNRNRRD